MPHSLRFMIDNDMVGMSWVDVLAGTYMVRPKSHKKTTPNLTLTSMMTSSSTRSILQIQPYR